MVDDGARFGVDTVRILGPLELVATGRSISAGGERQCALLAVLALRANEVVTADELIDAFFGPVGTGALHTAISRLRRVLGTDWVQTHPVGYVLRADANCLDSIQAREMAARAMRAEDPVERVHALRATEALWRGPVLAGVDLPISFRAEATRLTELHRALVAERIDTELALGHHADVVGELDALTQANPFDERLHRARALALYGVGRQAEALSALGRYRSTLRDELGLDPSSELREVERAILNHDTALLTSKPDSMLPAATTESAPSPPGAGPVALSSTSASDLLSGTLATADGGPPSPQRRPRRRVLAVVLAVVLVAAAGIIAFVRADSEGVRLSELQVGTVALVPVGSDRAERMVEVGSVPRAIALGFDATWVTDLTDQTVSRVGEDGSLTVTGLGVTATGLAAGRDAMWAIAGSDGDVIRLESMTGRVLVRIPLEPGLTDIAAGDQSVWVTNADAGTVTQIDAGRNEPVATIANLAGPTGVVVTADGVWIAERRGRRLVHVDARRTAIIDAIPVDLPPGDLVVTAGTIWAANQGAGTVTRVDMRERTAEVISVGRLPTAVAASGSTVYALNDLDHSISEIHAATGKVVRTLSLSDPVTQGPRQITPGGIAADDEGLWMSVQSY
jgi:DNA-binding SARP family transcriptional activator